MAKLLDPDDLTYSVNSATNMLRFNTTAKTIQLVAGGALVAKDGVTGQCLFSKIKEAIKASASLISIPLPVREMIHDESMELVNGWTFADTATVKMVRDCGVAYVNTAGATTAMFACFVSLGTLPAAMADADIYFAQSSATNATTSTFTHVNKSTTFGVNELVQIYSDTNGDGTPDYDYRSYVKVFCRPEAHTYAESSNADIGYPELTYKKYNFPITSAADAGVTVTDATLDGAGYSSLAMQWYASAQSASLGTNGPYNFRVLITGGGKTYDEIYSWVQRQLRKTSDVDAGAGNRTGKVTASLVVMDGNILKTRYQSGLGGVHIVNPSATSYNNIQEYDDTNTLRSYPLSVSVALEFDSYLQADADSYFWIFPTANYGTPGAAVLQSSTGVDMKGAATANTSYSYVHTVDVPITGIALGLEGAKVAEATGTITSSGAKLVFVAGLERWYADPA
jgi:hypothetical protein